MTERELTKSLTSSRYVDFKQDRIIECIIWMTECVIHTHEHRIFYEANDGTPAMGDDKIDDSEAGVIDH